MTSGDARARQALLTLSLVSGLGGVVYEVLYMRHLSSVLGDMFYVHAALLCMFLLGNGIGAWVAHRFVRQLWVFELAIGGYALLLPLLIGGYEGSAINHVFDDPVAQSLFASALLLAVPSICIGISIPLFSAYVRGRSGGDDAFKTVYLLYNLGAALSVIAVDFVLIREFGFRASLAMVGLANLSCGVILLTRRAAWTPAATPYRQGHAGGVPWRHTLALLLASTASALFIGFYLKTCYHLFLPQRENFAVCTSISLLAIAAGTWLVRRYRVGFPMLLALAMLTLTAIYAGFDWVPRGYHAFEIAVSQQQPGAPGGLLEPSWVALPKEILFGFLLAVPYVFLGATIPALLGSEGAGVARDSGLLLLVSGVGNAVGLTGFMFVAHPRLRIFTVTVVIWILLAAALAVHGGLRRRPAQLVPLAASLLLLPIVYRQPEAKIYLVHEEIPSGAEVVHFKATSDNVSYVHTPEQSYIRFNGQPSIYIWGDPAEPASAGRGNLAEAVSGVIPALFAPRLDEALVVGMGSGITAGAAALMFGHTDVVEINAAFLPLVEQIGRFNFDLTSNPAATIIHDDGRRFLSATDQKYDAIVNSVASPTYFAAGKIYTVEFLDKVKGALAPGGVYSAWFTPGDMSTAGVDTLLATLHDRFAHCNLGILRLGYYFTTCSDEPLVPRLDLDFPPALQEVLEGVRGVDLPAYLSSILVSEDIFARLDLDGVPLNTDDFPILEFQVMRLGRREQSLDPVVADPARFDIRLSADGEEDSLIDRAIVLRQIHRQLWASMYENVLTTDQRLAELYNARIDQAFPQ